MRYRQSTGGTVNLWTANSFDECEDIDWNTNESLIYYITRESSAFNIQTVSFSSPYPLKRFSLENTGRTISSGQGVFATRYKPGGHAYLMGVSNSELRCFAQGLSQDFTFIVTHPKYDLVNQENCISLKFTNQYSCDFERSDYDF